jgi:hypothetical protein
MFESPQYNRKRFISETITRPEAFCLKGFEYFLFEYFLEDIGRASLTAGEFRKFPSD